MDRYAAKEHRKYTAVLREELRGYAISPTRRPRGQAFVEIMDNNGLLNCTVKNLAPPVKQSVPGSYSVWLSSEDEAKTRQLEVGALAVRDDGTGEAAWKFALEQLNETGLDPDAGLILEVRVTLSARKTAGKRVLVGHLELAEATLPEDPKMEKVAPFGKGLPTYQWWKFYPPAKNDASGSRCDEMPGTMPISPVFQGHQLIGLLYDQSGAVQYLVHGVPGRFCLRDQPYGGATGYTYWHPLPGQEYKAGDYGYWLIHMDPLTGDVVRAKKATPPPDCDKCTREPDEF